MSYLLKQAGDYELGWDVETLSQHAPYPMQPSGPLRIWG